MEVAGDPFATFEGKMRRRFRVFLAGFIGLTVIQTAAFVWFSTLDSGVSWLLVYAFVFPALATPALWATRRTMDRLVGLVRGLRPRVRDVGMPLGSGLTFVFDSGLVGIVFGAALRFWLFASPAGSVALPGSVSETAEFRRGFWRMRAIGTVHAKRGPEAARRELAAIAERLGVRSARAFLYERPLTAQVSATAPAWAASATFFSARSMHHSERWLDAVDLLRTFLERLRTEHFAPGSPTSPSSTTRPS